MPLSLCKSVVLGIEFIVKTSPGVEAIGDEDKSDAVAGDRIIDQAGLDNKGGSRAEEYVKQTRRNTSAEW